MLSRCSLLFQRTRSILKLILSSSSKQAPLRHHSELPLTRQDICHFIRRSPAFLLQPHTATAEESGPTHRGNKAQLLERTRGSGSEVKVKGNKGFLPLRNSPTSSASEEEKAPASVNHPCWERHLETIPDKLLLSHSPSFSSAAVKRRVWGATARRGATRGHDALRKEKRLNLQILR